MSYLVILTFWGKIFNNLNIFLLYLHLKLWIRLIQHLFIFLFKVHKLSRLNWWDLLFHPYFILYFLCNRSCFKGIPHHHSLNWWRNWIFPSWCYRRFETCNTDRLSLHWKWKKWWRSWICISLIIIYRLFSWGCLALNLLLILFKKESATYKRYSIRLGRFSKYLWS